MRNKLAIIGIDSLDPYVLLKYRNELPVFDRLMKGSPTFKSKSVFPVDTIPAWTSIFTGLNPENHGTFYVYDIFDPNLSDLRKVNVCQSKGKTFWDYAGQAGYRSGIVYPQLLYPAWDIDGFMVSKSPFDRRVDWLSADIDVDVYPKNLKDTYEIPDKISSLWGGFPGEKYLSKWADLGKSTLDLETGVGMKLYKNEKWDLFFIYFSLLDIIQHRLWRYFDENDPMYSNRPEFKKVVLDYYKYFDRSVGEFMEVYPDMPMIIMSDHGHKSRPVKTFNINEHLRTKSYLSARGQRLNVIGTLKNLSLSVATKLNLEPWLIKLVVKSKSATKVSKSLYSSSGSIDKEKSLAWASHFAGIKSYPHGGIEINRSLVSDSEYKRVTNELISSLLSLKAPDGLPLVQWVKRREELHGTYVDTIYPDLIFELRTDYGVGWDVYSKLFGTSFDHKVASGGHGEDAVFLMHNINRTVAKKEISIVDTTPTVLDILEIDRAQRKFDGTSMIGHR